MNSKVEVIPALEKCILTACYKHATGCFKKNFTLDISIISPVINKLEGWDILDLKGGIHSSVLSTKTLLYDIREPRCKQIKMGYQIFKNLDIGQS